MSSTNTSNPRKLSTGSLARGVAKLTVSSSSSSSNSAGRGSGSQNSNSSGSGDMSPPSGSPKPRDRANSGSPPPGISLNGKKEKEKEKEDATGTRRRLSVMGADARTVDGAEDKDRAAAAAAVAATSLTSQTAESKLPASATRRRLSVMGAANAGVEHLDGIADLTGESKIDKMKVARSLSITADTTKLPSQLSTQGKAPETKKKKLFSHFVSHSKVGYVPFNPHKVNQDRPVEIPKFGGHDEKAFFGVFDGHGALGHEVSSFLIKELPLKFLAQKNLDTDAEAAIQAAFLETNEKLANSAIDCMYSGSTGIVVYMYGKKLFSCNAGDSRAVLARQNGDRYEAIALSDDQKPDRPDEKKRILESRGRVEACKGARGEDIGPPRVWLAHQDVPGLAMSRSFGDLIAASVGVIARPEVWERELDPNDKFFMLASDGIWEFISNQEAVDIVSKHAGDRGQFAETAVKELVAESVRRWNREEEVVDDITCLIVFLSQ